MGPTRLVDCLFAAWCFQEGVLVLSAEMVDVAAWSVSAEMVGMVAWFVSAEMAGALAVWPAFVETAGVSVA